MPIIKSAKKRVRVAKKATVRNSKTKRSLRTALKAFQTALTSGDKKKIADAQSKAYKAIDTAAKKNILHKNKASRKKSQLSAKVKAAGVTAKDVAKKAPTKAPVKKTATKPATKKPTTKKPAAKKTTKK